MLYSKCSTTYDNSTKIWIDDIRIAPDGFIWCKSTHEAITTIKGLWIDSELTNKPCNLYIDIDHDAGYYADDGGDYINILNAIERFNYEGASISPIIHIHSMNVVGIQNMKTIIERNGWEEA